VSVIIKDTRVSAAADKPARRRGSAHAKYSVSHHMVIKPFLLLGLAAEYRSQRWVWSSEVYDTHRRTKLTAHATSSHSRDIFDNHCLNLPSLFFVPPLGVTPLEFRLHFWHQKTRVPGLSLRCCLRDPRFSHLSRTPTCDGQTDTRWRHVPF